MIKVSKLMEINAQNYSIRSDYVESFNSKFSEISPEGLSAIKDDVPSNIILKIATHPGPTVFVSTSELLGGVELKTTGSYSVYTENLVWLATVNLHRGLFGTTFAELNYFSKLPKWSVLYVSYTKNDLKPEMLLIIKKD